LLKRNKPRKGRFSSPSLGVVGFSDRQQAIAFPQLLFIFFAEENKLTEQIRMNK